MVSAATAKAVSSSAENDVIDHRWQHDDESIHTKALGFVLEDGPLRIRRLQLADIQQAAKVCYDSFNKFNKSVGLPPEFPPQEVVDAVGLNLSLGAQDGTVGEEKGFVSFVCVNEADEVVGSNMLQFQDDGVGGIGPLSSSTKGGGKLLMKAAMKEAALRNIKSVRLLQVISNPKSFSLYLSLGFEPRRTNLQYEGHFNTTVEEPQGYTLVPYSGQHVDECNSLHMMVCHTCRKNRLVMDLDSPHPAFVCIDDETGKIVAYTTGSCLDGHTVALREDALKALIIAQSKAIEQAQAAGAPIPTTTLFVPHQYSGVARWLAENGFRLVRQLTSMSYGPHYEPKSGYYFPSIFY